VETTLTHPFLTIDGWRPLSELQVGDRVAVPRVLPVFGSRSMPEHEIKLLAYFIGDGTVTADVPRFTNSNPVVQAEFTDAIHHFPGLSVRCDTSNGQRTPTFYVVGDQDFVYSQRQTFAAELNQALEVSPLPAYAIAEKIGVTPSLISQWRHGVCVPSRQVEEKLNHIFDLESICISVDIDTVRREHWNVIKDWLKTHQLWGKNAHQKSIPSCIFQLPKSQLSLFINRLFTTDGWASVLQSGQVQLGYTSVNRELVSQLQHLLLRFGIIGSIKERNIRYKGERRQAWQLDITHAESICIFLEEIGIFGKEGSVNLAKQSIQARRRQSNRDLIPLELWSKLKTLKGNESWSSLAKRAGIKGYSNIHAGKRDFSRSRLFCLAQALGNQNLINIATSDVYWDAVINIEYIGDHQVYDLTIPKTHNFIANDICVHNTAVSLNIAQNIAKTYRLPIAIFSLEMSKEQLVQRLLSSEAGIEANRLRAGRVSQNEWEPFNNALTSLSEMPIFIDDTPNIVVSEIRSKCRRLQAEQGQNLGLVLLDYLQLMEGGGDNRVQELSRITRSLKGLARELNVPVIALSQLSRGVEARTNKRPMMSDLRESGCLAGDTLVTLTSGERVPIRDLVDRENVQIWALDEQDLKLKPASVSHAFLTGIKLIYRLTTRLGRTIDATANHKFRVLDGWVRLDGLKVTQSLAIPNEHDVVWDEITSIEPIGETDVYDLTVPGFHNFVANDIVVHNSIEQDADLIVMLYRDEYYNPDTPDRGITEMIIAKHRNGPTGIVKLLFESQYTRFRNMAGGFQAGSLNPNQPGQLPPM
jgi:replicative DNA helicase